MQGRRVVEDELDIEVKQIGEAIVDGLFNALLVRLQEIHRAIEVMQREPLAALDTHLLGQPLLVAGKLRGRRTGSIGHQRPLQREVELA